MKFGLQFGSVIGGLSSFLVGLIAIFGCHYLAKYTNLFDKPDQLRKFHARVTPNSGGIGIAIAYSLGLALSCYLATGGITDNMIHFAPYFLIGTTIIIALGVIDDISGISSKTKLLIQLAAAIVTCAGLEITFMDGFLAGTSRGAASVFLLKGGLYILFAFWIVSITNSINLVDGVDGLASVLALLVMAGILIIGISWGITEYSIILYPLAGAVLAFLVFNRPPAYIFMGDTGSLLIGYVLATIALMLAIQAQHWMHSISLIILFGFPLLDTLLAVIRRIGNNVSPFESDSNHLHHLLQRHYNGAGMVILVIGSISLLLTIIGIVLATTTDPLLFYLLFGLTALAFVFTVVLYSLNGNKNTMKFKAGSHPRK